MQQPVSLTARLMALMRVLQKDLPMASMTA
jgi:hypothetical protein